MAYLLLGLVVGVSSRIPAIGVGIFIVPALALLFGVMPGLAAEGGKENTGGKNAFYECTPKRHTCTGISPAGVQVCADQQDVDCASAAPDLRGCKPFRIDRSALHTEGSALLAVKSESIPSSAGVLAHNATVRISRSDGSFVFVDMVGGGYRMEDTGVCELK